jgi:hypothetical protein
MILSLNTRMMESQVDARLTGEMQQYANAVLSAIQEEVRSVDDIVSLSESEIRFVSTNKETVKIFRYGRDLKIEKTTSPQGTPQTKTYPARLSSIKFDIVDIGEEGQTLLRVFIESESNASEKVATSPSRQRAYAQRDFYLRNVQ